jgi:hypothetical protein
MRIDNVDGTFTVEEEDNLWDLYGEEWKEKTEYNIAAKRFNNLVSGRFVTNTTGYTYYFLSPSTGILYSIS